MQNQLAARLVPSPVTPENPLHAFVFAPRSSTLSDADMHTCFELGVVLAGRHERHVQGLVFRMKPGDVWLNPGWEPHGWRMPDPATRAVVVHFLPELLNDERVRGLPWLSLFAAEPASRPRIRSEHRRRQTLALGREMRREVERQEPGWQEALRLDMLRLLLILCRDWDRPTRQEHEVRARLGDLTRIMPAVQLVRAVPLRRVGRQEAAVACCLGVRQFSEVFHRVMGVSYGQFALRARLAAAAQYLVCTNLPVEAVARHTGFVDAGHLHRAFRERYRQTPAQYRQARLRAPMALADQRLPSLPGQEEETEVARASW
jgi:AraC-like DNA-binding protein